MHPLNRPNLYQLLTYDPGGTIGVAHYVVDFHAFTRPENKLLTNLLYWNSWECTGSETQQEEQLVRVMQQYHYVNGRRIRTDVVGEDFDLVQTVGGAELLSPVRINAVVKWECDKLSIPFHLQRRHLRTTVTRSRLKLWGFGESFKKDEFAAMQHGMYWLRTLKQHTLSKPWKLESDSATNAHWDCACERRKRCDLTHPK